MNSQQLQAFAHNVNLSLSLAAALSLLISCGYDHSTEVGKALLYQADGKLDVATASEILNKRFPLGSRFHDLQSLVKTLDGRCYRGLSPGQMGCDISINGTFCMSTDMFLTVSTSTDEALVERIDATIGSKSC